MTFQVDFLPLDILESQVWRFCLTDLLCWLFFLLFCLLVCLILGIVGQMCSESMVTWWFLEIIFFHFGWVPVAIIAWMWFWIRHQGLPGNCTACPVFVFTALTEDCCVSSPRQVPGPFSLWSWLQYFLLLARKIVSIVTAPILSRHAESSRIFRWGNIWGLQLTSVMPVFLALGPVEIHCFAMPPISPNRS